MPSGASPTRLPWNSTSARSPLALLARSSLPPPPGSPFWSRPLPAITLRSAGSGPPTTMVRKKIDRPSAEVPVV
jgi:hypothetical protein